MVDWKKEIKLSDLVRGRKHADAEPSEEPRADPSVTAEKTSIWKKELSFGRKRKDSNREDVVEAGSVPAAEAAKEPVPAPAAPTAEAPSFAAAASADPIAPTEHASQIEVQSVPAAATGEVPSFAPAEPAAAFAPTEHASQIEVQSVPAAATGEVPSFAPAEPAAAFAPTEHAGPIEVQSMPAAATGEAPSFAPAAPAAPFAPTEHAGPIEVQFEPAAATGEAPSFAPAEPAAPIVSPEHPAAEGAVQAEPAQVAEPWATAPAAAQPEPAPPPAQHQPVIEPAQPAPQLPPAVAPPSQTAAPQPAEPVHEVVHPPVPADELPALADDEDRKPFYKRSLSFRRKRSGSEAEPRAAKAKPRSGGRSRRQTGAAANRKKVPKTLVGLKIGASQLAAARIANNGDAELVQVARAALAPGIVVGGELREPDALADALKEFFATHNLPKRGVRLGIANNRIGVRTFEIVGIEDSKQLANAITFRAQEALPIPIDEAVLDYQILHESTNEEGATVRRILLVVAYRELVDRYVHACRKAGVHLVGIDLEAFALLRALAAPRGEAVPDAALVAVTIGHERSTFAVTDGRACEFTRVLEWGGAALDVAIARALDIAPSEAEPFKLELSLHGAEVPDGLSEAQAAAARDAMARQIQAFARELVSSLQFYQNQPGSLGIGEIVITGGTAHLPGLSNELQRLIGVVVRVGDPLGRVRLAKKFREPEQVGSFAVAIGLGIED